MNKSKLLNKIKKILLITGSLIVISGIFLPLSESCELCGTCESEVIFTKIYGGELMSYYFSIVALLYIYRLSEQGKRGIIGILSITILSAIITGFFNVLHAAGWGKPCGESITDYQKFIYLGDLMVITGSVLNWINNNVSEEEN